MSELTLIRSTSNGDYYAKIEQDTDLSNPREEWDHIDHMACRHRNYTLGDKEHEFKDMVDFLRNLDGVEYKDSYYDMDEDDVIKRLQVQAEKSNIILPLYLYDHSGITMKTTPFGCPWDSGQVGFIYMSNKEIRENFSCKKITKKVREQAIKYMTASVEVYDDYLTGNVYGYICYTAVKSDDFDPDTDEIEDFAEQGDSCWGFYGDIEKSGIMDEVNSHIDYMEKEANDKRKKSISEHFQQLKQWIKNKVPVMYREPLQIA